MLFVEISEHLRSHESKSTAYKSVHCSHVWLTSSMSETGRATGVRAMARAQMSAEILDVAREQLAHQGAGALSLRAVAREVGMASSAIYRYFDSKDALLTALIIDAYNSLGESVELAEGAVAREDLLDRWRALAFSVRSWALANPHLYALVYGSPVPGYTAPQDTVGPASRATAVLAVVLRDVVERDESLGAHTRAISGARALGPSVEQGIAGLQDFLGDNVPPELVVRALMVWTGVFGAVSFELFGQLHGAVAAERRDEVFAAEVDRWAAWLDLTPGPQEVETEGRGAPGSGVS